MPLTDAIFLPHPEDFSADLVSHKRTSWEFGQHEGISRPRFDFVNPSAFFVLYQKSAVELVTQEGAAIWAAFTNIESASKRR